MSKIILLFIILDTVYFTVSSYAIKTSYLTNLIDLMPSPPRLQSVSSVAGKSLTEQVKILRKFTYIIEVNQ